MKISLLDVQQVFNDLLNHKISREDAEEWARKRMNALVNQDLTFDPPIKEELLWKALVYLSGVGLKISPDKYMEEENGIKEILLIIERLCCTKI
ncbi:TPA: hypothetical protein R1P52_000492 [Acinetobacter baumannii]|uniref:hypothetical protein n=1 Tax=Acinetobacter baumannii TaxID=470 RepID=UPI00128ED086|nr:hypothetical protein [Acinetobacter baumannii]QFV05722.1 hypothetical protein DLI69_18480 [Acinetobacter baumannii]HAV6041717.1 hypothetical protein [Acinetobacter baumannii]HAV6106045.1 hypothetical protein [Acinetobacter baumannii]HAV6122485.1 hypothetical protein [Acinetobacter baumannii]HAV6140685.1 hypothetical protein [Acinetobacter baumannii]